MDLSKVSTQRLLGMIKVIRRKLVQPWLYYREQEDLEQHEIDQLHLDNLKKELATREHYERGIEGRKTRQKAKQK